MVLRGSETVIKADVIARVDAILAEATLTEKVGMMSGKGFFLAFREDEGVWGARPYRAGSGIERLDTVSFAGRTPRGSRTVAGTIRRHSRCRMGR